MLPPNQDEPIPRLVSLGGCVFPKRMPFEFHASHPSMLFSKTLYNRFGTSGYCWGIAFCSDMAWHSSYMAPVPVGLGLQAWALLYSPSFLWILPLLDIFGVWEVTYYSGLWRDRMEDWRRIPGSPMRAEIFSPPRFYACLPLIIRNIYSRDGLLVGTAFLDAIFLTQQADVADAFSRWVRAAFYSVRRYLHRAKARHDGQFANGSGTTDDLVLLRLAVPGCCAFFSRLLGRTIAITRTRRAVDCTP